MRTKPTLMFAASAFIVTAVLFAAAMVVASSLSIPDPARRFLPPSVRGLPGEQAPDDVELANDNRVGQAQAPEPVPEVTAFPQPDADVDATPGPAGSAVSSSGDTMADGSGSPAPFAPSKGDTPSAPQGPYSGPPWSWERPSTPASTPASPAGREPDPSEPDPSESEPSDPEPSEPVPSDGPSTSGSVPTVPPPSESTPAATSPSEPPPSDGTTE